MRTAKDAACSTELPPLMGKRELLEWAAEVSGVSACRQYDDLRDGLVLLALAQATYPDDVPSRFLRVQKRFGQPREATKNWELLLRCLHRHGVPAVLCAHEKITKGHARCCFNALVLFYFLYTLSSSPGATVSVRFSSPVDPRLIQFLHSPQGQQAVQPRHTTAARRSTAPSHRSDARSASSSTKHGTSSQRHEDNASVDGEIEARGARRNRGHHDSALEGKEQPHSATSSAFVSHKRRERARSASASHRSASVEVDQLQRRERSPSATRPLSHGEASTAGITLSPERLEENEPTTHIALLSNELEHVKAMAQLALAQQAMRGELQAHILRSETAQRQLELDHVRASHALLLKSTQNRSDGAPSATSSRHASEDDALPSVNTLDARMRQAEHALEVKQQELATLQNTVQAVLDAQARICQTVLLENLDEESATEASTSVQAAVDTLLQQYLPFLEQLTSLSSSPDATETLRGLRSCMYALATAAQSLQLENARLRRQGQSTEAPASSHTSHVDASRSGVAARGDLVRRLEAAVEDQAHEIAALRAAVRRARREAEAAIQQRQQQPAVHGVADKSVPPAPTTRAQDRPSRAHSHRPHRGSERRAHRATSPTAEAHALHPRDTNALSTRRPQCDVSPPAVMPTTTASSTSLLVSAAELERRKAAIFDKYSALMTTHS